MALTLDQLFPQSGQPTQSTPGLTLDELFPPVSTVESEPVIEEKPESGFGAHLTKSLYDSRDYISLALSGLDGAEGNEEEIARIVAETSRRQNEVIKSAQHQYLLDVVRRESKDVKDAEGFADTALAVLDASGKTIWTAVTNPLGVAEFGASQAGNMAVAVGGMFAGGLAGIPGGPLGIAIGSRVGAGTAGASVETGAAYIEALMKAGVDVTDQVEVERAISDPEFQREMYKKGYTKGLTIGIVDAAFMGLSKMPGTGAGRELRKDLLKEGIDIKKNADWEKIAVRHAEGDEVVTAAFKKYAEAPRAKAIGTKRMTIETLGEGVGEGLGGLAAFGETSFEDIALEMLGSTAQSAVQASVSASLSGSKQLLQKATKEALRQQADSVAKGEASGIEPEELNESLRRQKEGVGAQLDTVSATISAFEDGIGESDNAQSVIDTLRTALTLEGFANYRLNLQSALQTEDTYPNGVMPFYVALTKEEQATLAAGGSLPAPVKGSLNRANVKTLKGKTDKKGENFGGQDVVLVKVPVSSVIMRGNWDKLELVVEAKGMQLAAVPQAPQQTETKPVLSEKLEQEADRLAREDVETTLQTEVEIGELEAQAIDRSKKDVDLDTREATDKAARKLAQLREPDNYETVAQLQGAVDRNKVPLFPGQRRKRPPLALALQNYRKALEKPDNINALNDVLAPTGYKLSKKADGIHVVPIDNKPALRVPNTGNREVGQSTVDDYLFWINEEQTKKAPETTEKKQAALKKEAAQVEARKPPRENVQSIIDSIEKNFVTRKGNKVTIDEEGLSDILAQAKNIAGWSKADRGRLDQYVRSLRKEQELQTPTKKAPVAGTTITVPQSAGALTSLESSFKRTGKSKFIERVRKLLTDKKGNDALLAEIAKAYRKANPGKAEGDLASILTLTGKADQANIAKAYALAQMLITLRSSVSTIRPDNTLAIEDGNLSAFMRFDKVLDGVKENQLVGQIKQVFGEDSTYTRINDFEVVVTNPKLTPIQFARRFGRLRGKRNDIRKSELFTAQIETHTHDWTKDPSGESIRSEIRRLGFGSILQYVDDRRADYLDIAEEFGAKEVAQYRQAPRAPPQETAAEETEAADEAAFSLEGQAIVFSRKIENKKEPMGFVPDQAEYRKYPKESGLAKGILVKMTPQEFLNLVPNRTEDSNVEAILDRLEQGDRMAPPFLNVEITKNGLQITGHEGRGRMIVATSLGLTDEIEVDVFFNRDRVEDFDAIDPKPVFISQTGRADIDTVEPQVTVPLRRLEDTSLDKADESVAFSLAETTKVYPGEYELTASDGTKYKVVQAEPEETFGPGREWKLYRATKENPDYHADFDWDWMDTFPRLKDAKAWVEDRTAEGPLFSLEQVDDAENFQIEEDEAIGFYDYKSDKDLSTEEQRQKLSSRKFKLLQKRLGYAEEAVSKFNDIGVPIFVYHKPFDSTGGFFAYDTKEDGTLVDPEIHINVGRAKTLAQITKTLSHEMAHAVIATKLFPNNKDSVAFFNKIYSDNRAAINTWSALNYATESNAVKAEEWLVWSIDQEIAAIVSGKQDSFSLSIRRIVDRIAKLLFETLGFNYQRQEVAQIIKDATTALINDSQRIEVTAENQTDEGPLFALGDRKKRRIGEGKDTEDKTTRHLEDLEKTIPESERTARASRGKRKTVDGGDYLDLNLDQAGKGMLGLTQEELTSLWEASVGDTSNSEAAREIISKLNMAPKDVEFWDDALRLPDRARYWYEVSAESFEKILRVSKGDLKRFIAIVSATSPQANPIVNMKRAIGVFAQYMAGEPIDMDLTIPQNVREALKYGTLSGLKTGSFAGTMQYILGLENTAPLSTNDRQVASSFGVTGDDIATNPILYETLSRFYINLRDKLNSQLPPGAEPFETWQLQALGWVEERATSEATDTTRDQTDDYLSALQSEDKGKRRGVIPILKSAGIIKNDFLTDNDLRNPAIPSALSGTLDRYREKQKLTIEIGSPFSDLQAEAKALAQEAFKNDPVAAREFLETFTSVLYASGRGVTNPFNELVSAVTGKKTTLTRLQSPTSESPFDIAGTYEGEVSPNVRVPMPANMADEDMRVVMAVIGRAWKQAAMAHSNFQDKGKAEGVDTHSVFVETTENLGTDGALFGQFSSALPDGHEVIIERWPNGYMLHVTPSFTDEGPVSLDAKTINTEATKTFGDTVKVGPTIFSGDYIEADDYGKIISRFRNKLRQDIRKFEAIKDGNNLSKRDVRNLQTKAEASARRLDNLDSAIRKANKLQQEFEKRQRQWVEKYRKRLSPEAASLTPIDKPASGGFSASGLRRALVSKFGEKGIARLEADGILVIVESAADLPAGLIKDQDAAQRARGLFDPKTNTAYLIANRLNRVTAPKVLLHEVGTHFGLKRMLGDTAYADLIVELEAGKDTTFKPWYDRIRANYGGRVNEGTDRFAEEVLAAIAEDTSEITLPLRTRIWRAIKKFLIGAGLPKNLTPQEIGYVIQGSLRKAMRQNDLALAKMPRFMRMEGGDVQLGAAAIAFPEYTQPTRKLTEKHKRYDIISAIDKVLNRSEELRLRRNMDGMMKVAERVYKKGYKNIDVHLPVVSPNTSITSRYAMFKNTQTGTELVIRMSDHPKDPFVAAGSFPFVSYNNGHKTDMTDLSDIERAVKLLSAGKLDGMNGLQFQFEYSLGDGVAGISKANSQKFTYEQFLRGLQKKNPSMFNRVQDNAQMELRSGAVIGEEGPVFSLNRNSGLDEASKAAIAKTSGRAGRRSAGEMVSDARNRWWQKGVQNWVDAYRPIKNLLGDQATRAWQMMQLSENAHGMLHAMLHYGAPKARYHNGEFDWYDVDFSREGLLDILKDLDGEADRFMSWMVYTRANRLAKEEREKNFTTEEIVAGLKLNQQSKNDMMKSGRDRRVVYQQAMRKMSKLQDSVLQMAVDAGVIDETVRETLDTDFYVPFYREFTSEGKTAVRGPTPSHDFVNIKSIVNRLRGSEENINDALQNMMMNWTTIMSAAMKNRAGVAAMEAATKAGVATLIASKKDIANIEFSKGKSRNEKFDSFVYVLKDGKKVWYEVNDPLVLNAMASLVWGGVDSKALRTLSTFKRWLTIGVTASPAFKIRNLIRDTVHSIAVGKLSYNALGNASTGYQTLKDNHLVTANMMMGGATFQFGFYNDDPAAIRRMVDAVGEGRILDTTAKARKAMGFLFNWYQDIGNRMENANRASLYLKRKEEVGHLQASMEGRDLLNFSQHGRGVAAQWLMASMPFLQARINGLDKLARSGAKGERARMLTVVGTVTLASILLRLSYEGDEDYEELEEWQKDTYWPIKIPGTKDFFFLPKPFEIGAIASMGERITENFIRDAGELGMNDYTRARITDALMHQLAVDWRPQIVKPMVELWQNKNSFTDRQIENITWQMNNLPKELRVRAYTSDFSIKSSWAVGEMLDLIGLKESGLHVSPVQMDHLIKGYFGWIGATTAGAFDILSSDVDPLTRIDEMRGLLPAGSFYSGSPRKSTKYLTLFYDQMGEVKGLKAAFDAYKRRRMVDEARAVVSDNKDVMRWLRTYNKANEAMQKINKRIGFIYDDKDMSPADKRKEIDRLNEMKVGIAKKIVLRRAEREAEEGIESDNPLASLRAEN